MIIAARQSFLTQSKPYDAEIEYLESTGTQYIDTKVPSQNNLVYDFGLVETTANNQKSFFGFAETTGSEWYSNGENLTNFGSFWYYIGFANGETKINNFNYPNRNGIHHYDFTNGNAKASCNGTQIWTSNKTGTYTGTRNVFIFWIDAAPGTQSYNKQKRIGSGRITFFKISQNGTPLFDGIPVRVGSVGYLYDRVSKKLFGNAGTGSFGLGSDIVPIKYLESSGTQWIDTGVTSPTSSIKFDGKVQFLNNGGENIVFGNHRSSPNGGTFFGVLYNTTWYSWHGSGSGWQLNGASTNTWYDVQYEDSSSTGRTLVIDGVSNTNTGKTNDFKQAVTYKLFRREGSNSNLRIASCKIYKDSVLVRDLIPVRIGQVGYMFNKDTRQLFGNQGTGSFILGPDK